jgi:16S rRNA (cytosine1402-N4)-methyltransferase
MTPHPPRHVPVLPVEVLNLLAPASGEVWVDATTGSGGHARLLAERVVPHGRLIAIDQDPGMLERARVRLEGLSATFLHANFDQLPAALALAGVERIDGLLADLGVCSDQLDSPERGLSFQQEGPLDMRLDPTARETAADLLARLDERELADIFWRFGEERFSRRIARRIVEQRRTAAPPRTTTQFAELVRRCVPRDKHSRIDPATRAFQGLRIAVNDELGSLERLLAQLPRLVKPGGRVGIISFHSLEDRLVKRSFQERTNWEALVRKPVMAGEEEVRANPRSRSAKFRAARRIADHGPGQKISG